MFSLTKAKFEQTLFRRLNALVEPAVRHGFASSSLTPASLIVLETTGYKSGQRRRTPLWSLGLGRYRIVSTVRGERSFWVKNLRSRAPVSYYLGGRRRESEPVVIAAGIVEPHSATLTPFLRQLSAALARYTTGGLVLAILVPAQQRQPQ